MDRGTLERRLQRLDGFADPRVEFEQYPTPPDIAAHLVHLAALQGDLARPVVDLGSGTGVLALGAALAGAPSVVGVERDADAIATARENAARLELPADSAVTWVRGDATRPPLCPSAVTVVSNPPFGAQRGNEHADRAFLAATADLATVSYTIHNAGSRGFVESFVADRGGEVTHAFAAAFDVDRQFAFHTDDRRTLDTEVFRIEW
ncbi:METTL5 family protein [Halomarina rubra]|uniref:METTL5 family protein n=1 Tax=Halomarina rubra TaxID=2071873 RepID=A0ABD6ATE2_9EURY|nr:METTL5 family protein [Halomarina rubra]